MTKIEDMKKRAMVRVHSHGAFGENESYDKLDVEKFYELIVLDCVKEVKKCEAWNSTAELKLHTTNCILWEMGLEQFCENKGETDVVQV